MGFCLVGVVLGRLLLFECIGLWWSVKVLRE